MKANELSKVLHVDLNKKNFWVEERSDLFQEYLGGAGVGIQLLKEECPKDANPLGENNPIILSVGLFNGIFPLGSKMVAMFKSPLTGNLGETHAGGRCGVSLRMVGLGAVIIKGKSDIPIYLVINNDGVKFRDASALWGLNNSLTVGRIIREVEGDLGVRTIMRIGKAGEKLVRYANVMTETYRHFGRLGLGAVFGSKLLKAIQISGKNSFSFKSPKAYRDFYDGLFKQFTTSPLMKKYHEIGTAMNVLSLNQSKSLPTKNLLLNRFEGAENLSGEALVKNYLGKRVACAHCPVACIHIANLRDPYENEPYFYKTKPIGYDYELIYSVGSMLDIRSPESFLKLVDKIEALGVDVMSMGVCLAWATEAMEKGLITKADTGGLELKWGDANSYLKAIEQTVSQPNDFFKTLGQGTRVASKKYGGEEFALNFGGNEMPGYHTGMAGHLGFLVSARHSHLDGAGYSLDIKNAALNKAPNPTEAAKYLFEEESWRQILSSLVVCYFARNIYTPELVVKGLEILEIQRSADQLKKLGEKILREKNAFKIREGFSFNKEFLSIPKRILETESALGFVKEDDIREGIKVFKELLGFKS